MSDSDGDRRMAPDARELRAVEHAVARIVAETERPVEVCEATLEAIGRALDLSLGLM